MPLSTISTAENTVSRARAFSCPAAVSMAATISEASIAVTASASTTEPKGSPTFSATTSA